MATGGLMASIAPAAPPAPVRAKRQWWRRQLVAAAVLLVILAMLAPVYRDLVDHGAPDARAGLLTLRPGTALNRPIRLEGGWQAQRLDENEPAFVLPVPSSWVGLPDAAGHPLPAHGVVRYALTIRGLAPGTYSLYIPVLYEATRVWVDGRLAGGIGQFGLDATSTRYRIGASEVTLIAAGRDVHLAIDIAAFHHRDTGIDEAPVLGSTRSMSGWSALQWLRDGLFITALLLVSLFGLVIYFYRREDRAFLLLGLAFGSLLPVPLIYGHDNILSLVAPSLPFALILTMQYVSIAVSLLLLTHYVAILFPVETVRRVNRVLTVLLALLIATHVTLALAGATVAMSHVSKWSEPPRLLAFVYLIGVAAQAVRRRRTGAFVFLFGIGVLLVTVGLRTLTTSDLLPSSIAANINFTALGILAFLFAQVIIMAERWTFALRTAERMTDDQRKLLDVSSSITSEIQLEALLGKIVAAASDIVQADRSSLFLHDEQRDQLWSVVAEGMAERISFPSFAGLAGHVFTDGVPANVADAYADPRFNTTVDKASGYRTRSILTVPIRARDGRKLGVLQALNALEDEAFSEADIARLTAFAAQAAIAIDNARLFSEVVAERNYSNSILGSMSSGVVTVEADTRVTKLNAAARRIMRSDDAASDDHVALAMLRANPWLLPELQQVRESGQPKTILDRDARTLDGHAVSINLNIVPLTFEDARTGLLAIVDDISHGKRLQGTMRRFMSQEVVEQVMANDDGILFGQACEASILFADIRGFTTMSERLSPRDTVDMLNGIFTELFEAVATAGGMLDKFIGDAIMAVFGAPLPTGRDPAAAIGSALQMFADIARLNVARAARDLTPLRLGIGIASGDVVAGTIGSPKRMEYTVIGDSVNLASRLQSLSKTYGVDLIVDDRTARSAADEVTLRELDLIRVRGRETPVRIFGLRADEVGQPPSALWGAYAKGRACMDAGNWEAAVAAFEQALTLDPADHPSALMRSRAAKLADAPPVVWDGVWSEAA